MGKTVAYLRASTDKQDLNHQKLVLLEFARKRGVKIDEFVEVTISSRKTSKQRRIDELLQLLNKTDTLIVTELSRLGRSTAEDDRPGQRVGPAKYPADRYQTKPRYPAAGYELQGHRNPLLAIF